MERVCSGPAAPGKITEGIWPQLWPPRHTRHPSRPPSQRRSHSPRRPPAILPRSRRARDRRLLPFCCTVSAGLLLLVSPSLVVLPLRPHLPARHFALLTDAAAPKRGSPRLTVHPRPGRSLRPPPHLVHAAPTRPSDRARARPTDQDGHAGCHRLNGRVSPLPQPLPTARPSANTRCPRGREPPSQPAIANHVFGPDEVVPYTRRLVSAPPPLSLVLSSPPSRLPPDPARPPETAVQASLIPYPRCIAAVRRRRPPPRPLPPPAEPSASMSSSPTVVKATEVRRPPVQPVRVRQLGRAGRGLGPRSDRPSPV